MALMKYTEIMALAKDKMKEVMAPLRAREMKVKAELELAKLDSKIMEEEQKIQEIASEYPVDFDRMINALDRVDLTRRRKKQFTTIINEMFPEK